MTFNETLYARDDEMDEFGDSGAYGDSLEEDYEEEEEEEAEVAGVIEPQPEPVAPPPAAPKPSGGGGSPKPPRKPAAKKPAKKKPAKKVAKKKPAKKKASAQGCEEEGRQEEACTQGSPEKRQTRPTVGSGLFHRLCWWIATIPRGIAVGYPARFRSIVSLSAKPGRALLDRTAEGSCPHVVRCRRARDASASR